MQRDFESAYEVLFSWCQKRNFAGYDPFDALNSRLFQATPLKYSSLARFAWTQVVKRSPLNLRRLARVPPEQNPKGIALFSLAALANYRRTRTKENEIDPRELLDDLVAMQLSGWSGAAWGYNFDWQSRTFFAPRGTPMIVPTAFAVRALVEASLLFPDENYLSIARSACDFILQDLQRSHESKTEICFSYSPNSLTHIYNASLLAAEALALVGGVTKEQTLCELSLRAAEFVVQQQREDGAWTYGAAKSQRWIDNFHTSFVLLSLAKIMERCPGGQVVRFKRSLQRGYDFWRTSFFLADGWPKYYDDRLYPADAHAAGAAIVTFCEFRELDAQALSLARKIALWSIHNLRDRHGFFYYQRQRFSTVSTPFMRWSEAWMLYALGRLLEVENNQQNA